jgi:hypothetical protein
MLTKKRLLFAGMLILFLSFCAFAQYTGFDLEGKKPPSSYPGVGPGEHEIVNQLLQTNRLLQRNNQLLADQNRILRDLARTKSRK